MSTNHMGKRSRSPPKSNGSDQPARVELFHVFVKIGGIQSYCGAFSTLEKAEANPATMSRLPILMRVRPIFVKCGDRFSF